MVERPVARVEEGLLTDELLAEMRAKAGLKLRIEESVFNRLATREAIARFADGVGDPNPLWHDPEYAARSPYGRLVAPPSWVVSVFAGQQFGWRGLGGFHGGTTFRFLRPVLEGDEVRAECTYLGFEGPKPSSFADRIVIDRYRNEYFNQNGQLVATADWHVVRAERRRAREKGKYHSLQLPHPWREEELQEIEEKILSESPRGDRPRFWEEVSVGEELPPVIKGPLGLTDIIAFLIGGGAPIPRLRAHGAQLRQYQRHPAWGFRDPFTYAKEPIFAVHYNVAAANALGVPYPYDVGFQRHCWQIHLLTNWMGDDAWVAESSCEYRRFVFLSDVVWLTGRVVAKGVNEAGERYVEIETAATNQRGENVMPGRAIVILPSREEGGSLIRRRFGLP